MSEKTNKLTSVAALRAFALGCLTVLPLTACSQSTSSTAGNWMAPSSRSDLASIQTETSTVALVTALSELEPDGRRFAFAADVDVMQPVRRADPALSQHAQMTAVLTQIGLAARDEGETIHIERALAAAPQVTKTQVAEAEKPVPAPVVLSEAKKPVEVTSVPEPVAAVAQPTTAALRDNTIMGTPVRHPKDRKTQPVEPVAVAARAPESNEIASLIERDAQAGNKRLNTGTLMGNPVVHKGDRKLAAAAPAVEVATAKTGISSTDRADAGSARLTNQTLMSGPVLSKGDRRPAQAVAAAKPSSIEDLIGKNSDVASRRKAGSDTAAPQPEMARAGVDAVAPAAMTVSVRVPGIKPLPVQTAQLAAEPAPQAEPVVVAAVEAPASGKARKSWSRKADEEAATLPLPVVSPEAEDSKTDDVATIIARSEAPAARGKEPITLEPVAPVLASAPQAVQPSVKMAVPGIKPRPIIQAALVIPQEETVSDHVATAVQSANAEAGLDTAMGVDTRPERVVNVKKAVHMPDLWTAKRGQTLRAVLDNWCDRAGAQLIWRSEFDYPLAADITLQGDFEIAVRKILQGFATAAPQPVGRLHRQSTAGASVLIISARGNDYGDN